MAGSRHGWEGVVLGAEAGGHRGPRMEGNVTMDQPRIWCTLSEFVLVCRWKD